MIDSSEDVYSESEKSNVEENQTKNNDEMVCVAAKNDSIMEVESNVENQMDVVDNNPIEANMLVEEITSPEHPFNEPENVKTNEKIENDKDQLDDISDDELLLVPESAKDEQTDGGKMQLDEISDDEFVDVFDLLKENENLFCEADDISSEDKLTEGSIEINKSIDVAPKLQDTKSDESIANRAIENEADVICDENIDATELANEIQTLPGAKLDDNIEINVNKANETESVVNDEKIQSNDSFLVANESDNNENKINENEADVSIAEDDTAKSIDVALELENEPFETHETNQDTGNESEIDISNKNNQITDCLEDITECESKSSKMDEEIEAAEDMNINQDRENELNENMHESEENNQTIVSLDKTSIENNLNDLEMNTKDEIKIEKDVNNTNGNEPDFLRKECLNIECSKKCKIFYDAPEFIINHFHLSKRQKYMHICDECFNNVIDNYEELCAAIEDKQPLFQKNIRYADPVEIIDSSDEEDDTMDVKHEKFNTETLALIENELENIMSQTLDRIDIKQQMDWNRQVLSAKIDFNEAMSQDIANGIKVIQKLSDSLYYDTYANRPNFIEEVKSLDLVTRLPMQICDETYPPNGPIDFPEITKNTLYYTFRSKVSANWQPCKVINIIDTDESTKYVIKFLRENKRYSSYKDVAAKKFLAYGTSPKNRLNIGTRVIALYDNSNPFKNTFYPGIIAEPLTKYTKFRYLVFFDDGYVQYVYHDNIRLMCGTVENVWELIEEQAARQFIEDYIKGYRKKRAIVNVRKGQRLQTEWNGKWYSTLVSNIDGSLVQLYYEEANKWEWIYRGSTRLLPLFKQLKKPPAQIKINEAVEYIVIDDDKEPIQTAEPPEAANPPEEQVKTPNQESTTQIQRTFASQAARDTPQQKQREQKRAVAKKSTTQQRPAIQNMNNSTIYVDEDKPKGKVVYYTAKKQMQAKKYMHHECGSSCIPIMSHNLTSYSPLSKPLLSGWERQICKTKHNKKFVVYRGPCGKRLRDMKELHKYIRMTFCRLNVDNFDFDPLVHCLAEYVIDTCVMKKADLSEGVERMNVSLINCYDHTMPPPCAYSSTRIPTEGVPLNLDSEFLCGCDCEDDCLDKEKCQCWQLTLAGAKYGNPDTPIDLIGYEYKRLLEQVQTGIYECNSRCKCKSNCLNRVVQQPLQMKLQVFKTMNRGWGMRCLNDVPKG